MTTTTPVSHGLMFAEPMILALLAGRKTVTRRLNDRSHYAPGQILYARETYRAIRHLPSNRLFIQYSAGAKVLPAPSEYEPHGKSIPDRPYGREALASIWMPSIHMPRVLARIQRRIVDVRDEPIHMITDRDAIAEGIEPLTNIGPCRACGWKDYRGGPGFLTPIVSFATLWDSLAPDGAKFIDNPTVKRIEFM